MSLVYELKRRNVFRVGAAYLIASWLLIQVADTVFPYLGVPDSWTTALIIMLAIGFPLALLFAWIYELTPQGLRKDDDLTAPNPLAPVTARRLNLGIIALLVVAVSYLLVDKFYLAPASGAAATRAPSAQGSSPVGAPSEGEAPSQPVPVAGQSVAVLPFRAMSAGEEDEYFADGLTEEILNSLTRLPELLVTARTSSFYFKDKDIPVPEIARTLGVANVVEGSVRRAGETVRITAQLIRADDGFHLWSETYDRTLADVFAVQEDIALNIAKTLSVVLDDRQRRDLLSTGTRDIDAFIAYQKARHAHAEAHIDLSNLMETLEAAEPLFDTALALDPGLGQAWFLRSDRAAHLLFAAASLPEAAEYPADDMARAAERMAADLDLAMENTEGEEQRRVVELDHVLLSGSWRGLGAITEAALASRSCVTGNWMAAVILFDPQAANAFFERMVVCDPLNYTHWLQLMYTELWASPPEQMRESVARSIEITGERTAWSDFTTLQSHLVEGAYAAARSVSTEFENNVMVNMPFELRILAAEGRTEEARALAQATLPPETTRLETRLTVAAMLGDRAEANRLAGIIDARPLGYFALVFDTLNCVCGPLFDLDAAPDFARRIEEAGVSWPPAARVEYPAKTW